ncbi:MAG: AraC family transcriptional regulator [Pseudomonadota bacterium]
MKQIDALSAPQAIRIEESHYHLASFTPGSHDVEVPRGWAVLDVYLGNTEGKLDVVGMNDAPETSVARSFNFIPPSEPYTLHFIRSGCTVVFFFKHDAINISSARAVISAVGDPMWNITDAAMLGVGEIVADFLHSATNAIKPAEYDFVCDMFSARLMQLLTRTEKIALQPNPAIQRAMEFIEASLHTNIVHNDVARAAGLSAYHFARNFRIATGMSVRRYIMLQRLKLAQDLITNSNESLAQIAFTSGFSSQSHMSTQFKRFTGRTPRSYRQSGTHRIT